MKKGIIILLSAVLTIPFCSLAQEEAVSAGFRMGRSSGITLKFWSAENRAIEGMISSRGRDLELTVMKIIYRPILLKRTMHIFAYGGWGGHLGYDWGSRYGEYDESPRFFRSGPLAGVDIMIGAEYRFFKVPVSLGIDFKPYAEFSATRFFSLNLCDFGLHFNYNFQYRKH